MPSSFTPRHFRRHLSLMQLKQLWLILLLVTTMTCLWLMTSPSYPLLTPRPGPSPRLLTVAYPDGSRTGNLMFVYASLVGLATYHNMTSIMPRTFPLRAIFDLPMREGDASNLTRRRDYQEFGRRACAYDIHTKDLGYHKDFILSGYFQSWMYFENVDRDLHKHFRFKPEIASAAAGFHDHLALPRGTVRVGVHVRRGDIANDDRLRGYGYTVGSKEYFANAIKFFQQTHPSVIFVVCSDDMSWSRDNIQGPDIRYCPDHSASQDLAILAACDHTIMSVGSFGWWAAWLANGTTVYYKNWPRPVTILEYNVDKRQYFPEHWIPME